MSILRPYFRVSRLLAVVSVATAVAVAGAQVPKPTATGTKPAPIPSATKPVATSTAPVAKPSASAPAVAKPATAPSATPSATKPIAATTPTAKPNASPTATKPVAVAAPKPTASPTATKPVAIAAPTPSATKPVVATPVAMQTGTAAKPAPTGTATAVKPDPNAKPTAKMPTTPTTTPATVTPPATTTSTATTTAAAPSAWGKKVLAEKSKFSAVDAQGVVAAKAELNQAVAALNAYFAQMGEYGPAWKNYLRWSELEAQLAKNSGYDTAALAKVQRRFSGGFVGLEEPEFAAVGTKLATFISRAEAVQNANLQADYAKHLDALAASLDQIGAGAPTADQSVAVASEIAWLERNGQVTPALTELKNSYSNSNLLIEVSEKFLADTIAQPVDETEPVRDCILGTSISGTGRTVGNVGVELVENPNQAQFTTIFDAVNNSRTVGSNRSALIYSVGTTKLDAGTTLFLDDRGWAAGPITANARVNSRITGFGSTKGGIIGKLVKKIAAKKAPQQQGQAQAIASQHARQRLAGRMRDQVAKLVVDANAEINNRIRKPLERFGQYPERLNYSSTHDALLVRALETTPGRLGAPTAPPQPAVGSLVSVRVHQSLVSNSAQGALAGRKFDQERMKLLIESTAGKVPDRLKPDADEEPFSITFADNDPVTVGFKDGIVSFTVRGKAFTSGDKAYDGMNITGHYKLETIGHGFKATRQGEFDIIPPGFKRGSGEKLALRQTILKNILIKKFNKLLPEQIVREGAPFEGELAKLGTFYVSNVKADGDWLVLGLQRDPQSGKIVSERPWMIPLEVVAAE